MVGNVASVTAVPARTSARSAPNSGTPPALGGKDLSAADQDLPAAQEVVAAADLANAMRKLNETMAAAQRNLSFRVDQGSGRTVITVVDAATHEVIRQIPAEEVLAVSRALDVAGGLIDAHA